MPHIPAPPKETDWDKVYDKLVEAQNRSLIQRIKRLFK